MVGTDGVVEIFQGTSSGVTPFTSVGTLALAQQMKDVVLADMDKDGDLDLVASTPDPTDRGLYIVPNTNPSAFQFDTGAVQKQAGPPIDALAVGDVNKDGDPDVVAVGVPGGIYNQGGRVYLGR